MHSRSFRKVASFRFLADYSSNVSHTTGSTSKPLLNMSIGSLLNKKSNDLPHKNALRSFKEDLRWTYTDLKFWTTAVGNGFLNNRVISNSVLGVYLDNTVDNIVTKIAASKCGIYFTSLNPNSSKSEIENFLTTAQPRSLLITRNQLQTFQEIIPELKRPGPDLIGSWKYPFLKQVLRNDREDLPDRSVQLEDILILHPLEDRVAEYFKTVTPTSPAQVREISSNNYAVVTQEALVNNGYLVGLGLGLDYNDRVCSDLPLWTTYGQSIAFGTFAHDAVFTIPSNEQGDEEAILECVSTDKCTTLIVHPSVLQRLVNSPTFTKSDLKSLKTVLIVVSPGEKLPSQELIQSFSQVVQAKTRTAFASPDTGFFLLTDESSPAGSIGKVLPHTQCIISDGNNKQVQAGSEGIIQTKGHHLPSRKFHANPNSVGALIEDWHHVDVNARVDEKGNFFLV